MTPQQELAQLLRVQCEAERSRIVALLRSPSAAFVNDLYNAAWHQWAATGNHALVRGVCGALADMIESQQQEGGEKTS